VEDYKVKLEVFEGPLDLLLYLIKRDEVDIYDISIERITKQYLAYLEAFQVLNIDLAGEFIVMAEDDPRFELIRQLIEYKKFKEAAAKLRDNEAMQLNLFARMPATPELPPAENLLVDEVGIFDLIHAFQKILKRIDAKKEDLREIFAENYTVSDKIDHVLRMAQPGVPLKFEELFADAASRTEIVVTFLAMLELIRLKQLRVRQEGHFGEIWIDRVTDTKPLFS